MSNKFTPHIPVSASEVLCTCKKSESRYKENYEGGGGIVWADGGNAMDSDYRSVW